MKKSKLLATSLLASALMMAGCNPGGSDDPSGENTDTCQHVDTNPLNHICDLCGETIGGHVFGEWSVKTPATFEAAGLEHRTCECGEEETKPIPQLVHNYATGDDWSKDADTHWHACTDEGYTSMKKDEATHADANADHNCDECGYLMSEHDMEDTWSYDAINHFHKCSFEGCNETNDAEAHTFNSWTVKDAPTYEENGVEARQCKVCDYEETRVIPSMKHTFGKQYVQGENTHYYQCLDVGFESLIKDEESHTFGEWNTVEEATFEKAGSKQRTCTVCGKVERETIQKLEHSFEEAYSTDEYKHWYACEDQGFESLKSGLENHVDVEEDGVCDVCQKVLSSGEVEEITLTSSRRIIGKGESIIIKANISKTGFCDDALVWTLLDKNGVAITGNQDTWAKLTVVDNETAIYECISTSTNSNDYANRSVRVELESDNQVNNQIKITNRIAPDSRTSTLKSFMGATNFDLPYNWAFRPDSMGSFSVIGNICSGNTATLYTAKPDGTNSEVISAYDEYLLGFRNLSQYTESVGTDYDDEVIFSKSGIGYDFEFHLYTIGDYTFIDCYKNDKPVVPTPEITEFPMEVAMDGLVGYIACDIIEPDDVEVYQVSGSTITAFGDASAYVAKLDEAGYVKKVQNSKTTALSPDGTLKVVVEDKGSYYTLQFDCSSVPSASDWTSTDKEMMMTYFGEVLPFVNYGFGAWYDYMEIGGYIYTSSSRIGAQEAAKAILDAEPSFVASVDETTYLYEKSISKYQKMVIQVNSGGQIRALIENISLTSWEAEDIASALGEDAVEQLPEFVKDGNKFIYSFGEQSAQIIVSHSETVVMDDYHDILVGAGFSTSDTGNNRTYVSESDTLTVVLSRTTASAKKFTITVTSHLPTGCSREFPIDGVLSHLHGEITAEGIPTPAGSMFHINDLGKYQVVITVMEGGSMSDYASALVAKSFALVETVYKNGNICVELASGEEGAYTAKFYLAEEPAVSWPDFSTYLSAIGFSNTTLPAAEDMTNAQYTSDYDDYEGCTYHTIIVTGSISDYLRVLQENGFYVYDASYMYYIYDTEEMGWYDPCFSLYEADTGVFCIEVAIYDF